MALHFVDKHSMDRGNPTPNRHDTIEDTIGRMAHGTTSMNYLPPGQVPDTQTPLYSGFKRLVASDTAEIVNDGSAETVTAVAHGLGYAPLVEGAINNATVTNIAGKVNIPLPAWAKVETSGGSVQFTIWISIMCDATNVYFYSVNGTGSPFSLAATYYLYQQQAVV